MAKKAQVYSDLTITEALGEMLKDARLDKGLSLGDIVFMTDFSRSTVINLDKGISTNIHYYIAYGQAIGLAILSGVDYKLTSKNDLPPERKDRIFLTIKIRKLQKDNFFSEKKSVNDVVSKLSEIHNIPKSTNFSTNTSRILLNFVEEKLVKIIEKQGRNNIYINF